MSFDTSAVQDKGYGLFTDVIPKDLIRETQQFLKREMDACLHKIRSETGIASFDKWVSGIDRLKGEDRLDQLTHETRNILCGHFRLETRLSEELKRVANSGRVLELVRQILGPGRLGLHMPPAARFVLPHNHYAGVPAHQDISYNRHLGSFLTVWVPMVDIDSDCGGVTFFEGPQPKIPDKDPSTGDFWLEPVSTEGLKPVAMQLEQGDCLVLDPRVVHGSSPNRSKRVRMSVDFRFFIVEGPNIKHFLDLAKGEVIEPGAAWE